MIQLRKKSDADQTVEPFNSAQKMLLWIAVLASFVVMIEGSIVNLALPAIKNDIGGGLETQQWVISAYLLTLGSLMLVSGSLADIYGRLKIMLIGLVGFGLTSLMCAIAWDSVVLIISRGLQGVAGALLVPSSLALLMSNFQGKQQAKAVGFWTAATSSTVLIAPLIGGAAVDYLSWRFVFYIILIPIIILIPMILKVRVDVHEEVKSGVHLDYFGALLTILGIGGLVFGFIEQDRYGWSSPLVVVSLIVGVVSLVAFVLWETRAKSPLVPLSLFKIRNFSVGNITTFFMYSAMSFGPTTLTLFLQEVAGFDATTAGLVLIPESIVFFLFSSYFGTLSGKYGPRIFMTLGPIILALGYAYLLLLGDHPNFWTDILPAMLIIGCGLSVVVAPLTSAVLGSVNPSQAGIASAINNSISRIAGIFPISLLGVILGGAMSVLGFHRAMLVVVVLLVIAGLVSWIGITNKSNAQS